MLVSNWLSLFDFRLMGCSWNPLKVGKDSPSILGLFIDTPVLSLLNIYCYRQKSLPLKFECIRLSLQYLRR